MSRVVKLVLALVTVQAVALLGVITVAIWASQGMLIRFAETQTARVSRDATAYVQGFLNPAKTTAETAGRLIGAGLLTPEQPAEMARYFLNLLAVHPTLDGIYYGDELGGFTFASRSEPDGTGPDGSGPDDTGAQGSAPGPFRVKQITADTTGRQTALTWYSENLQPMTGDLDPTDTYDPRTRPWFQSARSNQELIWTAPYLFFSSQRPGITAAAPTAQGAVGVDIQLSALSDFLADLDISPNGSAAVVSETGDIIAHSNPALVAVSGELGQSEQDPILSQALEIQGGLASMLAGEIRLSHFTVNENPWIGAALRLPESAAPWTVIITLPQKDILDPLSRVRQLTLLVAAIALVATAGLGALLARNLLRS